MIKTLIISVVLVFSMTAYAQGVPPSKTFEVSIFSVRMPVSENGTISIRECDECDYHSLRVTPDTRYLLNGEAMKLDRFRQALTQMRQHGDTTVNVKRDDTTNTVVNVRVYDE
jgi:biopolymer transport protein ExbD